jgi:replication factor C small subunit
MESYTSVSRFILICNWSSKIIEPIQSRCAVFRFKALIENDIEKFIERIVEAEKLKIDGAAITALIEITEGDLRRVANLLQSSASVDKKITEDVVYDVASRSKPTDVRDMLQLALKGNFEDARKKLQEMVLKQGLSGADLVTEIHKQIYTLDSLSEETKVRLIEKCGDYEFRISEGANELLQLEALLSQFLLLGNNKK